MKPADGWAGIACGLAATAAAAQADVKLHTHSHTAWSRRTAVEDRSLR